METVKLARPAVLVVKSVSRAPGSADPTRGEFGKGAKLPASPKGLSHALYLIAPASVNKHIAYIVPLVVTAM
jgi:hypothetical protein